MASTLFSAWVRPLDEMTWMRPRASTLLPNRWSASARCRSVSAREVAIGNTTSARVLRLLTFWPPGPLERVKRTFSSSPGIVTAPARRSSGIFALEHFERPHLALRRHGAFLLVLPVPVGKVRGLHPRFEIFARAPPRVDQVLG